MRIDGNSRSGSAAARGIGTRGGQSGTTFHVGGDAATPARLAPTGPSVPMAGIEALLALQGGFDPMEGRRKQLRRGRSLLDTLDALKADLLAGRGDEGHLNQLLVLIGQAREQTEPGLDGLLDDIELRARVELAKRGVFPAGR